MAEAISHLVVRNETEWGSGLGTWEELIVMVAITDWLSVSNFLIESRKSGGVE